MNWTDKKAILARLGHTGFKNEDHYDEWFSELDRVDQTPIRKAMCDAEENGFDWGRSYFTINKNCKNGTTNNRDKTGLLHSTTARV